MNAIKKITVAILLYICCYSFCFGAENLFYVLRNNAPDRMTAAQTSLSSLTNHFKSIDILVPQAYKIDENGVVWGAIDPDVLDFANKHSMKVMPLITNTEFNKDVVHKFLLNPSAQISAIQSILDVCNKQHYYGVQFDFEMIAIEDRDALTKFYEAAATALHKKGFVVSFAIAPLVSAPPLASDILKKLYVNWEGAYDLKKLGEAGDFVSIMAYNQHGAPTTPGPTASIQWIEEVIKYALQSIPAQKISLGVPDYSTYWFTGTDTGNASGKTTVQSVGISYEKAIYLIHKYKVNLQWDDKSKINFSIYEHDWLNEYIFLEDKKSFEAKLALAKKYNLRGISIFDLGTEDPTIWDVIK